MRVSMLVLISACAEHASTLDAAPGNLFKPDGITPASFACNRHFVDPTPEAVAPHAFSATVISQVSTPQLADAGAISLIDPATGSKAGQPTAALGPGGIATLNIAGNSRISYLVEADASACDPCVPSFQLDRLTSPDAQSTVLAATTFEVDYAAGFSEASGFLARQYLVGTVVDCDGDAVTNASVSVPGAALCGSDGTSPCIAYVRGRRATTTEVGTDASGQFVVYTAEPGEVAVTALGAVSGTEPTALGTLTARTFANAGSFSVSFGTTTPLRD